MIYLPEFCAKWSEVTQSCPTLCDPMDCSWPGSSVHGIFQVWILEWVAVSFSRGSSRPRDRTQVSRIVGRCFTIWATREAWILCKADLNSPITPPDSICVLWWLRWKESACNVGDLGQEDSCRNGHPPQYSCLGKTHGQRNLQYMGSQGVRRNWATNTLCVLI